MIISTPVTELVTVVCDIKTCLQDSLMAGMVTSGRSDSHSVFIATVGDNGVGGGVEKTSKSEHEIDGEGRKKKKKEKENETEISHVMPGRFKAHRTTRDNPSFSQSNLRSDRRTDTGH